MLNMFETFFGKKIFNRIYVKRFVMEQNFDTLKETMIILKDQESIEKLHQIFLDINKTIEKIPH